MKLGSTKSFLKQKLSLSCVIQQGQRRRECNYYKHAKIHSLLKETKFISENLKCFIIYSKSNFQCLQLKMDEIQPALKRYRKISPSLNVVYKIQYNEYRCNSVMT